MSKRKNKDMGCISSVIYIFLCLCGIAIIVSAMGGLFAFVAVVFIAIIFVRLSYYLIKKLYFFIKPRIFKPKLSALDAQKKLERANLLADIANKTTNRDEFYGSVSEIKATLMELSKYEGKLPFIGSPSADLKNLQYSEQTQIDLLEQRIYEKEKSEEKQEYKEEDFAFNSCENKAFEYNNVSIDRLDPLFVEVGRFIIEKDKASIGMIQRLFKIGFNRSARIMDQLAECGVVGEESGTKTREILMTSEQFEYFISNYNGNFSYYAIENKSYENDLMQERIKLYNNKYDYMEGHDFEYYCAELLRKNGFINVEVTPGSNDQGIDIIAFKEGVKYGIQCKCYSSDIGNKAVQEAFSGKAFYNCHVGVVLTNRYFTSSARELAEKNGVLLWDRDFLERLVESSEQTEF